MGMGKGNGFKKQRFGLRFSIEIKATDLAEQSAMLSTFDIVTRLLGFVGGPNLFVRVRVKAWWHRILRE